MNKIVKKSKNQGSGERKTKKTLLLHPPFGEVAQVVRASDS
jgi:hypothetical protein